MIRNVGDPLRAGVALGYVVGFSHSFLQNALLETTLATLGTYFREILRNYMHS
jgi:hypothetical protein